MSDHLVNHSTGLEMHVLPKKTKCTNTKTSKNMHKKQTNTKNNTTQLKIVSQIVHFKNFSSKSVKLHAEFDARQLLACLADWLGRLGTNELMTYTFLMNNAIIACTVWVFVFVLNCLLLKFKKKKIIIAYSSSWRKIPFLFV